MQQPIVLALDGHIARLGLNNPAKHNALSKAAIGQLIAHLDAIESNPDIRVLVLSGAGEETFCSGLELDALCAGEITTELFQAMTERLASLPIPKIAAINGNVYGGGVELGLVCDFRVGVEGMKLMVPAARFGLCYPVAGVRRFVARLGPDGAKRLLVASETLSGADLLQIGYLQYLCAPAELPGRVEGLANHIAGLGPLAVSAMLRMCDQIAAGTLDEAQARAWVDRCNESADLKTGLAAALEKRKPVFIGR